MGQNCRLLVVDEKEPLLEVISSFLTTLGHIVGTASNNSVAHRLVRTYTFDLMILDLSFVHQHGVDLLSVFSKARNNPPVIVLTSMGYDEQLLNQLLNSGATMPLSKTLPIEHLADSINCCLPHHS